MFGGCETQHVAGERIAREDRRAAEAERREAEGWGQEPGVPVPAVQVEHNEGNPFCECETCRAKGGSK